MLWTHHCTKTCVDGQLAATVNTHLWWQGDLRPDPEQRVARRVRLAVRRGEVHTAQGQELLGHCPLVTGGLKQHRAKGQQ